MKKYELTDETIEYIGHTLHRIRALRDFDGFIESESNLSHEGNCWVGDNAQVGDRAQVWGDAQVYGNVFGQAKIGGEASVFGWARVQGVESILADKQKEGAERVALQYTIAFNL